MLTRNGAGWVAILMNLDASTLVFAGGLVGIASALFLFMHWWQAREDWAAFSWAAASCGIAFGVFLVSLHAGIPDGPAQMIGPLGIAICSSEYWAAAQIFNRGSARRRPVIAAAAIGVAAMFVAGATGHVMLAVFLNTGLSAFFLWAAAVEFARGRDERLRGRSAMIFVLVMQGIATVLITTGWQSDLPWQGPRVDWSGLINFVGPLFSLGSAVALVTMLKDRSEIHHKRAAFADPLTGLPNRRALRAFVAKLFEARTSGGGPISVLAFDLDRFKAINDTHGHATGDQVLQVFADVLRRLAREKDMASRLGGEEFALVLADCDVEVALAVARRIRAAFQDDGRFVDGKTVNATVSVGVAACTEHGDSFEDLLARADEALYRAKSLGRNRVVLSSATTAGHRFAVTRIA